MGNARSLVQRHPLKAYFILTFIISWGAILLLIGPGGLPASADQVQLMGMALLLGPSCAMLIMTALVDGKPGFSRLWGRLKRWNVGVGSYALALLAAPATALLTLLTLAMVDPRFTPKIISADDGLSLVLMGVGAGLFIAFFEELGWTGFAVPRLLENSSALKSGVITGLLWGLWHFPPFWQADSFTGGLPLLLLLARLFSWIVAYRVLMVKLFERTRSLPAVMLMHTSLVVCMIAIEPPLEGADLLTYIVSWTVVLWAVVALGAYRSRRASG